MAHAATITMECNRDNKDGILQEVRRLLKFCIVIVSMVYYLPYYCDIVHRHRQTMDEGRGSKLKVEGACTQHKNGGKGRGRNFGDRGAEEVAGRTATWIPLCGDRPPATWNNWYSYVGINIKIYVGRFRIKVPHSPPRMYRGTPTYPWGSTKIS